MTDANDQAWVILARVVRPQGRRGEVLAEISTDFPERFAERKRLFLRTSGKSGEILTMNLDSHWIHKGRVVLKFSGIDSISDAEELRNCEVMIPREERMPLEDDAVYVSDLLDAEVFDISLGHVEAVGSIVDVVPEGPGPAMLVVRAGAGEEVLIPFVKAYLRAIDLAAKRLEMDLPAGLLTMQAPSTDEERLRDQTAREDH